MTQPVEAVALNEWQPLPHPGCRGVTVRPLLRAPAVSLALLRFELEGTIHEHRADFPVEVVCLEGAGFTSVAGVIAPLRAGQRVHWPAGLPHRLWTEGDPMLTLMVELAPAQP
jgi:quercetin dioxygenase-like cupin family protein